MSKERGKLLPIQVRRTWEEDGGQGMELSVFCTRLNATVPVDSCLGCEDCGGLHLDPSERDTFLMCRGSTEAENQARPAPPQVELPPPADPPVSSVMTSHVVCVSPELSLDALTLMMLERGISGAPVVDEKGKPLGVVSKTDLLRRQGSALEAAEVDAGPVKAGGYELDLGAGLHLTRLAEEIVEDIMMPMAFTIAETAPISQAAALMAHEGVHRLVVIGARSGAVVGILSAIDLLRWMARQHGYAVPLASERAATTSPEADGAS